MTRHHDILGLGAVWTATCSLLRTVVICVSLFGWPVAIVWLLLHFEVC